MSVMVFDIETVALPLECFDDIQQEYLFREAEALQDEVSRQEGREKIARSFSLSPITGQILCIGMMNPDTGRGRALYIADDFEESYPGREIEYISCSDESEMLEIFWEMASKFEIAVTFNGRAFDLPFLYLRSALLNIPISRRNWLSNRYSDQPHCDLLDQLSFYNPLSKWGATRGFNLDFYCKAFGIPSPKANGITGIDIPRMAAEGRFREIAQYCMGDVRATAELYRIWRERLKPQERKIP